MEKKVIIETKKVYNVTMPIPVSGEPILPKGRLMDYDGLPLEVLDRYTLEYLDEIIE